MDKKITILSEPFPHLIAENFYDEEELKILWEVLDLITEEQKFVSPGEIHGAWNYVNDRKVFLTNHKAILLNNFHKEKSYSGIFELFKKRFDYEFFNSFVSRFPQFISLLHVGHHSYCQIKARYYANGEYYKPHTDYKHDCVIFTYFNKDPKKYTGGELYFPEYGNYHFKCENNSLILAPAYVKHAVKKVRINEEDYNNNFGRYAITYFIGSLPSPIYPEVSDKWKIREWDKMNA